MTRPQRGSQKHPILLLLCCIGVLSGCWSEPSSNTVGAYDIKVIVVDPLNSATVYVGTNGGGIYKSTDGGVSWRTVNDGLFDLKVTALTADWLDSKWVYAGTEDGGFFFSSDFGENWTSSGTTTGSSQISGIRAVVIDRNQCQTSPCRHVYVGSQESGVWRSTDAGLTFEQINDGLSNTTVTALAVYPTLIDDPTTTRLYAGTEGSGFFRRRADETLWTEAAPGLKEQTQEEVVSMAVNPLVSSELYVGMSGGETGSGASGIYKSIDSGDHFTLAYKPDYLYTIFFVVPIIGPDEADLTLYAGADGMVRSVDRGLFWCILPDCIAPSEILQPGLTAFAAENVTNTGITHNTFYAGLFNRTLIKTTDGGQTWTTLDFQ